MPKRNFKFENDWCVEPGIHDVVSDNRISSADMPIAEKLEHCASELCTCNKANENVLKEDIDECRRELFCCCNQGPIADPI